MTEKKSTQNSCSKKGFETPFGDSYMLKLLMDSLPFSIFFKDKKSRFIKINKACAEKFGLSKPDDAVGKTDFDFFDDIHAEKAYQDEKRIMESGQPIVNEIESEFLTDVGKRKWSSTSKYPLFDEDGHISGTFGIARDITDKREAELALEESEKKYRNIFENIQDVIYHTNQEGIVTDISPSIEMYSGYKRSEIVGKPAFEFYYYREDHDNLIAMLKETGRVSDFEVRLKTRHDKLVHTSVNAHLIRNSRGDVTGVEGIMRDITDRKRAELELLDTTNFYDQILDNTSDGIFVCDSNLSYIYWNPAMEQLTGFKKENVMGKTPQDLFPHTQNEKHQNKLEQCLSGQEIQTGDYYFNIPETGKSGWVLSNYVPFKNNDGEITGLLGTVVNISKRKKAEQKLLESDKTLKKLSDQVPGVIFQYQQFPDGSSKFPFASREIATVYELKPEEVKEDASAVFERIHPDDLNQVEQGIKKSFKSLREWKEEYRVVLPKRGKRWLKATARPEKLGDGSVVWHGYMFDITESKKIQQANQQLKQQLQSVLDTVPNLIFVKDYDGEILLVNRATAEYFQSTPEDLKGKTDFDLGFDHEIAEKYLKINQAFLNSGESVRIEEGKAVSADGNKRWHQAIKVPFDYFGSDKPCLLIVVTDVTQIKEKEMELSETLNIVSEQNSRLMNFAHIVSHNLRNHAGNISMLLSILEAEEDESEREELLDHLSTASKRLNESIEGINEIVDMQAKSAQKNKELNVRENLKKVKDILSTEIIGKNVTIKEDVDDVTIFTNPAYFESILLNLMSNAIKYRHPDRKPVIDLKIKKDSDNLTITISDNGKGIDMEKFGKKLFGMYNTFHGNENAKGIGLYLIKNHIETLGGSIEVESEVDKGTMFTVTLPCDLDNLHSK